MSVKDWSPGASRPGHEASDSAPMQRGAVHQLSLTIDGASAVGGGEGTLATPEEEVRALVGLSTIHGVGPASLRSIYDIAQSWAVWFKVDQRSAAGLLSFAKARVSETEAQRAAADRPRLLEHAEDELRRMAAERITLITSMSPAFPERLRHVSNPPRWLYIQGEPSTLHRSDIVAVVGTRQPTNAGLALTRRVAEWLTRRDIAIVSGLAEGIDAAAQQVAVDWGSPTIAVLGHGIKVVFPASTAALRQSIVEAGGAVITEYLPSERYEARKFVQRNRLQAGLAGAVIAVEGNYQSGTARTVRFAREFDRLLIGVRANGSAVDIRTGIHDLIRELDGVVLDLAAPSANTDFAALLSGPMGRLVPERPVRSANPFLGRFLTAFQEFVERNPVSAEEFEYLVREMTDAWSRQSRLPSGS